MNAKEARMIEEMKAQTFGVEVEMNGIERERAAEVAAEYFGTRRHGYTGWEDGYSTYSAFDGEGRKWKFSKDVSIHGIDSQKCEMVTPVLTYDDMEALQGLIRVLRAAGAKSCPSRGCGVHIHVGGDGHTAKSIRNLVNLSARYERELAKMIMISSSRMNQYCQMVDRRFLEELNSRKPKTINDLANCWYTSQGSHRNDSHYDFTRYHMVNLHAFFNRYHTVEFRMFQFDEPSAERKGGLHAGQLKAMIQLCLAMSNCAKHASYIMNDAWSDMSEAQTMRTFFKRIGFVGDEFKTAREYFTRNVEKGNMIYSNRPEAVALRTGC